MKIVFYLANAAYKDIDYSRLEDGNPGLGGTEYVIIITALLITRKLKEHYLEDEIQLTVAAQETNTVVPGVTLSKVQKITDIARTDADYIFFKYEKDNYLILTEEITKLRNHGMKVPKIIIWAHNIIDRKERNIIDKDNNVIHVICVSREQLNLYRDHHLFLKSSYIYNGIPLAYLKKEKPSIPTFSSRPHEVTSIGNIDYYKGFHLIARVWKDVLAAVPDAKLNVIGTGGLYNRDAKLGKYGIAEESYENSFMPDICDENGKILPSVKFWGLMGIEKNDVLKRTRVGVPNPMGKESFCLVALEMQAMGALVTTMNYGGFRNTVYKTGMLYKDTDVLAKNIITLLKAEDNDLDGCYHWMEENFSYEKIAEDWMNFICALKDDKLTSGSDSLPEHYGEDDNLYKYREINRKIKSIIGYWLPTIEFYRSLLRRIWIS